jgi:hypothetical protein
MNEEITYLFTYCRNNIEYITNCRELAYVRTDEPDTITARPIYLS